MLEEDDGLDGIAGRGPVGGGESWGSDSAMLAMGCASPGNDLSEKADMKLARLAAQEKPRLKPRENSSTSSTEGRFFFVLSVQEAERGEGNGEYDRSVAGDAKGLASPRVDDEVLVSSCFRSALRLASLRGLSCVFSSR